MIFADAALRARVPPGVRSCLAEDDLGIRSGLVLHCKQQVAVDRSIVRIDSQRFPVGGNGVHRVPPVLVGVAQVGERPEMVGIGVDGAFEAGQRQGRASPGRRRPVRGCCRRRPCPAAGPAPARSSAAPLAPGPGSVAPDPGYCRLPADPAGGKALARSSAVRRPGGPDPLAPARGCYRQGRSPDEGRAPARSARSRDPARRASCARFPARKASRDHWAAKGRRVRNRPRPRRSRPCAAARHPG